MSINNHDNMPRLELARAYIPIQVWNEVFSKEEALCEGTLFPELVRPYIRENGRYDSYRGHKDGRYYE